MSFSIAAFPASRRALLLAALVFFPPLGPATAREGEAAAKPGCATQQEAVTTHTQSRVAFTARVGAICIGEGEKVQAEVGYVSFERVEKDGAPRPLAFLFNGGPGAGSAWLALGAASPWRLALGEAPAPSTPATTTDNAENWLAFADLVFLDPPGAGIGRILGDSDEARKTFWSSRGDIEALAEAIRKWMAKHKRPDTRTFLVGESYGGYRAVKLARRLAERENIGVAGLLLISPALDFSFIDNPRNLLSYAATLPSMAASARGAMERKDIADVEAYAQGEYVADLVAGVKDRTRLERMSANVARMLGLPIETVLRFGARIDLHTFARERERAAGRVLSVYDATVSGFDPDPYASASGWADPVLDALRAPFGAAMTALLAGPLAAPMAEARYEILNDDIAHRWDWGRGGRRGVEAVSDLREALALDPKLRVTIVHGLHDLVTPWFADKMLLDQLPNYGDPRRVRLETAAGGHMFYLRDDSRRRLRDIARDAIEGK